MVCFTKSIFDRCGWKTRKVSNALKNLGPYQNVSKKYPIQFCWKQNRSALNLSYKSSRLNYITAVICEHSISVESKPLGFIRSYGLLSENIFNRKKPLVDFITQSRVQCRYIGSKYSWGTIEAYVRHVQLKWNISKNLT